MRISKKQPNGLGCKYTAMRKGRERTNRKGSVQCTFPHLYSEWQNVANCFNLHFGSPPCQCTESLHASVQWTPSTIRNVCGDYQGTPNKSTNNPNVFWLVGRAAKESQSGALMKVVRKGHAHLLVSCGLTLLTLCQPCIASRTWSARVRLSIHGRSRP